MKNQQGFLLALTLLAFVGCKESFFDINENQNNPPVTESQPGAILPMVLNATAKKMVTDYDFAAHWMGYWARGGSYGPSLPLENYDITTSYQINHWVNGNTSVINPAISWYDILMDAEVMGQRADELNLPFYKGAAKVIKSIGFMYLVDMYNNVPYTEAFDIINHIAPAYDKGTDIYRDLVLQLDTASMIFSSELDITTEVATSDILFGGDTDRWRKLVNTQRLKLLIHQSEVLGGAPTSEMAKIMADGNGFLMAGETAEVQPGYANNQYQQNPFYGTYWRDHNGNLIDDFNRANNYLLNKYRDNEDPRYQYVFREAINPLENVLYRGADFGGRNVTGLVSSMQSSVAGPGLAESPTQAQWLFTSVESLFLQAEAAQRGWLSSVNAQSAYEDAVTESFAWLGITGTAEDGTIISPEAIANEYLQEQEIASWSAAPDKLELIITQKYLALPGINNFEAWVDYRRLGVPADVPLSLNSTTAGRHIPLRLLYPQDEYSFNATNVAAEGPINAQTSRIFWDVD